MLEQKYRELAVKCIDLFHDHFEDKARVDMIQVAESFLYAYFCTLNAQARHIGKDLTPHEINDLVFNITDIIGHELAVKGIARPSISRQ